MPTIQNSVSIAANATNENIFAGSQFEYLPYNARLDFALVGAAAGLLADVYTGQDVLTENMGVSAANRTPIWPDDYNLADVAAGGERVKARVRNTTGGAIVLFFALRITPI
jgi:hypothetical protein